MFAPCISSIKTLFIVPTDAHYYKIKEMLKQFKIVILAPTCFISRRNHQQGAVLCLAKTTEWVFRARRYRRSHCYGGISACCAGVRFAVETGTILSPLWPARLHNMPICRHNVDYVYTDEHRQTILVVLDKHRTAPWWWFLREPKHVGASVIILNCFNISMIL
jgi:hypothetical protein